MEAARMTLGASIIAASKILRHADIEMNMIYSNPVNSLGEAADALVEFEGSITNFARYENLLDSN